ncbi:MAG: aspartate kinase [Firmicutes bacterium]|nr:aspartate kinase [Bacillota bacterium]
MLKVLKFGGTSMADAAQYHKVRDIVLSDPTRRVVVVSAAGKRFSEDNKITDLLYLCYAHLQYGVSCDTIYAMIRERYCSIRDELGLKTDLEGEFDALREKMEHGISREELVSRGEYFSALLMAEYLGFEFIDATRWLYFHYDGTVDQEKSYAALRELVGEGCAVIPGFYGLMPDGKIRTLTRGGSDITGALAAAALDADVYENWTDVSGILMADPRIVDNPKPIERATYSELRQLSYSGAQVLHEMTVFPVREKNIPLNIRNTNDPSHPGTLVSEEFVEPRSSQQRFITGIAGKRDFSVVTISKKGMAGAVGTLRSIVEVFENNTVPICYTPTGIDVLSLVVPTEKLTPHLYSITDELRSEVHPDSIKVSDNIAIIAVVGRKMAFRAGTSGKIFAALGAQGINIRMISQGPDELNILVGVDNKDYAETIRVLYNAFVK